MYVFVCVLCVCRDASRKCGKYELVSRVAVYLAISAQDGVARIIQNTVIGTHTLYVCKARV